MVSVNFKSKPNSTKIPVDKPPKVGGEAKSENKPTVVIDCLASPYEVIEPSPKEIIDIYTDEDEFSNQGLDSKQSINKKKKQKQQKALQVTFRITYYSSYMPQFTITYISKIYSIVLLF